MVFQALPSLDTYSTPYFARYNKYLVSLANLIMQGRSCLQE